MFLRDLAFIGIDELALENDLLAADVETVDPVGALEDEAGD